MNRNRVSPAGTCPFLSLCLFLALAISALGQELYLKPGQPDGIALLPPPPAAGSCEEAADLASVRAIFNARTPAEEARAFKDARLSFALFAPAIGPVFQLDKLPKTQALLSRVKSEAGQIIDTPKDHWKRKRPYALDPTLSLRDPEPSASYPSGHSTRGTLYSLVIVELFPDKKEAILELGRTIGWDRILIGKHFPTDVYAGRVLGKAIFNELKASPAFQRDLAEARAEIEAAKQQAVTPARLEPVGVRAR